MCIHFLQTSQKYQNSHFAARQNLLISLAFSSRMWAVNIKTIFRWILLHTFTNTNTIKLYFEIFWLESQNISKYNFFSKYKVQIFFSFYTRSQKYIITQSFERNLEPNILKPNPDKLLTHKCTSLRSIPAPSRSALFNHKTSPDPTQTYLPTTYIQINVYTRVLVRFSPVGPYFLRALCISQKNDAHFSPGPIPNTRVHDKREARVTPLFFHYNTKSPPFKGGLKGWGFGSSKAVKNTVANLSLSESLSAREIAGSSFRFVGFVVWTNSLFVNCGGFSLFFFLTMDLLKKV